VCLRSWKRKSSSRTLLRQSPGGGALMEPQSGLARSWHDEIGRWPRCTAQRGCRGCSRGDSGTSPALVLHLRRQAIPPGLKYGSDTQKTRHPPVSSFPSYADESLFSQNALSAASLANLGMVLIRLLIMESSFRVSRRYAATGSSRFSHT
jgi:hypothetical protein